MGRLKDEWLSSQERGWTAPDTFVCNRCVREPYLASLIDRNQVTRRCSYCSRRGRLAVAPTSIVIEALNAALHLYFNEPNDAGVPYDGGYIVEPISTEDALWRLGLALPDGLFQVIASSFSDSTWVPSADGHWSSSHLGERLQTGWNEFERLVKRRTRYFFADHFPDDREEYAASEILQAIGHTASQLGCIRTLSAGSTIYRVRVRQPGDTWEANAESMGAPPEARTKAGRMNPVGISYFYGALERQTALAETVSPPPVDVVAAEFRLVEDVWILDLCRLPDLPPLFDVERYAERQRSQFLRSFAAAITKPVRKDGQEHVDYIPSQVVCEWFAQSFERQDGGVATGGRAVGGLLYPSAVLPAGHNLVLFPSRESRACRFKLVSYRTHAEMLIRTWEELVTALGLGC